MHASRSARWRRRSRRQASPGFFASTRCWVPVEPSTGAPRAARRCSRQCKRTPMESGRQKQPSSEKGPKPSAARRTGLQAGRLQQRLESPPRQPLRGGRGGTFQKSETAERPARVGPKPKNRVEQVIEPPKIIGADEHVASGPEHARHFPQCGFGRIKPRQNPKRDDDAEPAGGKFQVMHVTQGGGHSVLHSVRRRQLSGEIHHCRNGIDGMHRQAAAGQCDGHCAGPAADLQNGRLPRQTQRIHPGKCQFAPLLMDDGIHIRLKVNVAPEQRLRLEVPVNVVLLVRATHRSAVVCS